MLIVAGAVAVYNAIMKAYSTVPTPSFTRSFFISYGQPQTSGAFPASQHIGPRPDVLATPEFPGQCEPAGRTQAPSIVAISGFGGSRMRSQGNGPEHLASWLDRFGDLWRRFAESTLWLKLTLIGALAALLIAGYWVAPGVTTDNVWVFGGQAFAPDQLATAQAVLANAQVRKVVVKDRRIAVPLDQLISAQSALKKAKLDPLSITVIGCHGQTIYHEDGVCTLQIGNGCVLAERLAKPVVSDFRPRDVAAGGKGAPLAPYFDYLWFRHARRHRVLLNLGGIGNLTAIPAGAGPDQVIAFDTGPGNMVIDQLTAWHTAGRQGFDRHGRLAAQGQPNRLLLDQLLKDPWFKRKPPKSAGREQYGVEFIDALKATGLPPLDLIATATVFTAATVADQIARFVPFTPGDLIVAGGGARNPVIMRQLAAFLPGTAVSTSTDHGLDSDAKEAVFFAVLAHETWHGHPSSIPGATGARHASVLGKLSR